MKNIFTKIISGVVVLSMLGMYSPVFAASMTDMSDNMTRQKVSETSDHVISFTPATTDAGPTTVTFPSGFDVSGATGGSVSGQVVTVTGGVTAATPVSFTIANVVNPSSPANYTITLATGGDTGEITVPILADDQIQITAKVDQTLSFDVRDTTGGTNDDNAVGFGSLSATATRWATDDGTGAGSATDSSEFEAGTNASGGYTVAVSGATLTSGSNTIDALATAATPSTGTEQFGIAVSNGAGSGHGTIDGNYTGGTYYLDTTAEDDIVSTTGPSAAATYDVSYVANISAATEAGNYSTALTYTMTANF